MHGVDLQNYLLSRCIEEFFIVVNDTHRIDIFLADFDEGIDAWGVLNRQRRKHGR